MTRKEVSDYAVTPVQPTNRAGQLVVGRVEPRVRARVRISPRHTCRAQNQETSATEVGPYMAMQDSVRERNSPRPFGCIVRNLSPTTPHCYGNWRHSSFRLESLLLPVPGARHSTRLPTQKAGYTCTPYAKKDSQISFRSPRSRILGTITRGTLFNRGPSDVLPTRLHSTEPWRAKRGRGARGRRRSGQVAAGHLQGHRYAVQSLWASLLCAGKAHGSPAGRPRPCRSGSGGTKSALRPKARGRLGRPVALTEGQRTIVVFWSPPVWD